MRIRKKKKVLLPLTREEKIKLQQLRFSLSKTNYFVYDNLESVKPCLVLYVKEGTKISKVTKRSSMSDFLHECKKRVGLTKDVFESYKEAAVQIVDRAS